MTVPTFTITAVPRFLVTCDVLDCQWRQEHRTQDSAARDGQRHLDEWHGDSARSHSFDLDERETVLAWCEGINAGHWNPTEATKRHLRNLLLRLLLADSDRAPSDAHAADPSRPIRPQ